MVANVRKLLIIAVTLAFVGCASRMGDSDMAQCSYPDSPRTAAPSFICTPNITGFPVTTLRSAETSDVSVSERIQLVLDDQIIQWASGWSNDWYTDVDQRSQAKRWLLAYLKAEARVVRSRTSPRQVLWLLVGVPDTLDAIQNELAANAF